ncbi:MAG: (Dimethylallyl)adenosine tRNA methylthiotransferase miaB [Candidatus Gottesmanbacteria bacterium GW2011_GWA1_34_13]|uniref:(Dimethylallyl)adenosine tRNA methylthiotransferase miaB n=1 Tax=Candidatus Gottesmanbacteria bacterium GW2011_GWA1_34_13 TaxID=1618434 RepID=A0A0G0D969_9BACT|nr:MAG: (Dimethylallyl)adenosine tRNA methylthiotransferase miaB [Candidatus Gottesmanbacteria bacterium GW2011_GWA1_34_13]
MKYHITTFGCAANQADSERIAGWLKAKGMQPASTIELADYIVINSCMVRESAENRVYGLVNNLIKDSKTVRQLRQKDNNKKIILTGCMVGMAVRDKSGKFMQKVRETMPQVELIPIEEIGFDNLPIRDNKIHAWVPISNGCNNFCTYCVVPFTRGREVSRPYAEIIDEISKLAKDGYREITLIGQNVNSYGSDLISHPRESGDLKIPFFKGMTKEKIVSVAEQLRNDNKQQIKVTYVKHLGRLRIPTLFPHLLNEVCKISGVEKVDFISSNPWDFSDDLIKTIKMNTKITRHLHLPLQSGDDKVLQRMNRWYTAKQYLNLVNKIKSQIPNMTFSTDIIVGFPGETNEQFENTVKLCNKVGFTKAYIAEYSDRPITAAHKTFTDDIPYIEKKRRWKILDDLINQQNLRSGKYNVEKYRKIRKK